LDREPQELEAAKIEDEIPKEKKHSIVRNILPCKIMNIASNRGFPIIWSGESGYFCTKIWKAR
jgi:hypothetical protein